MGLIKKVRDLKEVKELIRWIFEGRAVQEERIGSVQF